MAWAWALNSLFSVGGTIGALILGSAFGFRWVAAIAALSYAGAAMVGRTLEVGPRSSREADGG